MILGENLNINCRF